MNRTVEEINAKIARGDAVVLTAQEVDDLVASGREREAREVDVVTTGTMGIMSGTYALLTFQVCPPGVHRRFVKAHLNGVPAQVGPCPNESLGIIDAMVFGTQESEERSDYGGAFLFRELVEGKDVTVRAVAENGREVEAALSIDDMSTARLMSSRNCFRNYRAFVNPSDRGFRSIFSSHPFPPHYNGLAFSGCGRFNPLQNDPALRAIGVGTKLLFNGAEGFVIGTGTRCSPKYPNLMTMAEMREMDPRQMGGFLTAAGPENLSTYAVPIPILDDDMLPSLLTSDRDIPLSIVDVRDRHKIGQIDYGQAWSGDRHIDLQDENCAHCPTCTAEEACPTRAISMAAGMPFVDRGRCVNCGACVPACPHGCYKAALGSVEAEVNGTLRRMPIICRSSDREGAVRAMEDLKRRIMDGRFTMTAKVADLRP